MKHYKSVFENEQELLQALIDIHLGGKKIELDPMYFKGNFYKDGIEQPFYKFDINPQLEGVLKANAGYLPMRNEHINNIILDPPFLFEIRNRKNSNYAYNTHTCYKGFEELKNVYIKIIKEAHRVLKNKGVLIFKCQDYTDSKTTMTHAFVYNWAIEQGFYAKDLAILVKPNKVYNPNTTQRHLRKIHTYFWVFIKN